MQPVQGCSDQRKQGLARPVLLFSSPSHLTTTMKSASRSGSAILACTCFSNTLRAVPRRALHVTARRWKGKDAEVVDTATGDAAASADAPASAFEASSCFRCRLIDCCRLSLLGLCDFNEVARRTQAAIRAILHHGPREPQSATSFHRKLPYNVLSPWKRSRSTWIHYLGRVLHRRNARSQHFDFSFRWRSHGCQT